MQLLLVHVWRDSLAKYGNCQMFFRYGTYCSFWCQFFVKKLFNAFVHQGMRLAVVTQNTLQLISLMMKFDKIRAWNNNDLIELILYISGVKLLKLGHFWSHLLSQLHPKCVSYNFIIYLLRPLSQFVECFVIVLFYLIFLMRYAVIINYIGILFFN